MFGFYFIFCVARQQLKLAFNLV